MATFLEKADFITIITTTSLDFLTGGDDSIINEMALEAIEEMKSFLATRYDVVAIFDAFGESRNRTILMYAKDIALYHIFSRRHTHVIPDNKLKRYQHALKWLKEVQEQLINPVDLPITTDTAKAMVVAGGNAKRENHQV